MSIVKELDHTGIRVADMDASLRLYRDLLGGTVIRDFTPTDGSMRLVYIQLAQGVLELISLKSPQNAQMGLAHIAFKLPQDADIYAAAQAVRNAGYNITVEPKPASSSLGQICFFEDMAGCTYELVKSEQNDHIANLANERILRLHHISIRVDNQSVANTENLLGNVLGLARGHSLEIGDNTWQSYKIGDNLIGLFNTKAAPRPPRPLALVVFDITDAADMRRHLVENGIEVTDIMTAGIGDIIFATGPDGEKLEFIERKERV